MITSNAFKNDTLSKNTQIIPLVVIEKFIVQDYGLAPFGSEPVYDRIFLSTNNIEVDGNYYKPLLLDIPSIKEEVDLTTGRHKISSVTLNISNMNYNNSKRLSEKLELYSFTNAIVSVYYK